VELIYPIPWQLMADSFATATEGIHMAFNHHSPELLLQLQQQQQAAATIACLMNFSLNNLLSFIFLKFKILILCK
jgi:hypothetical protein